MNESDRIEYLKQKRVDYKSRIDLEKRQNALLKFVAELNNIESELVQIKSSNISIENIASPTLYNKPEKPIYHEFRFKTKDEVTNVKSIIKNWILDQKPKKIFCKNELLINRDDWFEINGESLYRNFDLLYEKLEILYTIMLEPKSGNFINLFEFEYTVTIYKGTLKENEIEYHLIEML